MGVEIKSEDDIEGKVKDEEGGAVRERAIPCRWSVAEHNLFVSLLKERGKMWKENPEKCLHFSFRAKAWKEIAEAVGTKTE